MMKQNIKRIHGHGLDELSALLLQSSDILNDVVHLNPYSLGGWSNLNIRGHDSHLDFVLKLPWSTEKREINPYDHLYKICLNISKSGIAPVPLEVGHLNDSAETPFILLEFVNGDVYDSLTDISLKQMNSLKQSLGILSKLNPSDLPSYNTPSEYLDKILQSIEGHEWLPRSSDELARMKESFSELYPELYSITDAFGEWSKRTMHGDLWVPNIVFREQKSVFLDLENCAIGDSRYDIAYLLEASYSQETDYHQNIVTPQIRDTVNILRPLALSSVIAWSIERLLSMEFGIVEQSIATPSIRNEILEYVRMKLTRLRSLIIS